jgi:5-(carboxyamino)imidazole ribonucleotide synthase
MANILGEMWQQGEPDWAAAASAPNVKLHLYGKLEARPGRKMGHLTALAATPDQALKDVQAARRLMAGHANAHSF